MRAIVLAAAGSILLAGSAAAWAQELDTGAHAYRAINGEATTSYGGGGTAAATGGRSGDTGMFEGLSVISPNDPTYSYSAPPHAGQPATWELNGDDRGAGTSYPAIFGHDSGG